MDVYFLEAGFEELQATLSSHDQLNYILPLCALLSLLLGSHVMITMRQDRWVALALLAHHQAGIL